MFKIAFDTWTLASRFRYMGTYVYAQNLITQFKKIARTREDIRFCLFASLSDANDARLIEPERNLEIVNAPLLDYFRLWRLGGGSRAAARAHADVIFSPTSHNLPIRTVPMVCTIHDVIPITISSHSWKVTTLVRSLTWLSAKFSRAVITDSECSKKDLVRLYGVPESKVSIVYLGYDRSVFNDAAPDLELQRALLKKLGSEKPYILHHGTIQPRKNLTRLIEAYRLMLSRNRSLDVDLVLVGRLGWEYEEVLVAARDGAGRPGRVLLPGTLSGEDLALLIKGASLEAIPSLYEGFCLPMVEAMACGTPTVISNTSCLPEISGNVLPLFDPNSIEEIASQMQAVLCDTGLRLRLRKKGTERVKEFSWERCAKETLAVLLDVAPGKR